MEVGNITKAATFKSFVHLSYKCTKLLFFCDSVFIYFHKTNINRLFLGFTQKHELRVFFNQIIFTCYSLLNTEAVSGRCFKSGYLFCTKNSKDIKDSILAYTISCKIFFQLMIVVLKEKMNL